jgi:hypothetical protein
MIAIHDMIQPFRRMFAFSSVRCNHLLLLNIYVLNNLIEISLFRNKESVRCAIDIHRISSFYYIDYSIGMDLN